MKLKSSTLIILLSLVAGVLILLHQIITWGGIDYDQILHHEWFAAVLIAFSLGAVYIIGTRKFIGRASRGKYKLALILLALLLTPALVGASPTIYWLDGCENSFGWIHSGTGGLSGGFEVYTGNSHDGFACFRLWARDSTWGTQSGGTGYADGSVTERKPLGTLIPAVNGKYSYVIGGWVKVKQSTSQGSLSLFTYESNGAIITSYNIKVNSITLNAWHNVEMEVSTQEARFYVDGLLVAADQATRPNVQPYGFGISVLQPQRSGVVTSEVYFDTLYIAANPNLAPEETSTISIQAGGGGTTAPPPGDYEVLTGATYTITATSTTEGYPFSYFLMNGIRYDTNPLVFVVDKSYTIQAVFGASGTFDIFAFLEEKWLSVLIVAVFLLLLMRR